MSGDNKWFTEIFAASGSAFGLAITKKLDEVQSPFQHIEMFETTHFGNLMVIDGVIMLSTRDNFLYHEMLSHPVLFTHPDPQNVIIIGGGDCGTLREVLKHRSVQQVTQIDIDEQVTRMAERYFPELCASNQDPRATLLFADGIQYMRDAAPQSVDVVIVDSTDPIGPGEGLFNRAFYQSCFAALKPGGVLGVVEHRLPESKLNSDWTESGYMPQSLAIKLAEEAGFVLEGTSEVNANPKDTADHPQGVWTLPPSLALKEQDKAKYLAIGESDRMTLKFRKPKAQ